MDIDRYDFMLARRVGDASGEVYLPDWRRAALSGACYAYSKYFPAMRRFGTGTLYSKAPAGQPSVTAVGGIFSANDVVVFEPNSPSSEELTILSVAPAPTGNNAPSGAAMLVTFTSNLANVHTAGAPITRKTPGLSIVSGQDTYQLPRDFIQVDQDTLDLRLGLRGSVRRGDSFYNAAYTMSNRLSQSGFGTNQNYGYAYGWLGGRFENSQGQVQSTVDSSDTTFSFLLSDRSQLVITPTPNTSQVLDPLFYFGQHTPESIPDSAMEDLLIYGAWSVLTGKAAEWSGKPSYGQGDIHKSPEAQVRSAEGLAQGLLERWDLLTRFRPVITSG